MFENSTHRDLMRSELEYRLGRARREQAARRRRRLVTRPEVYTPTVRWP